MTPLLEPCGVTLDERSHVYSHPDKELMAVSSLIKRYDPPFDPTGQILTRCAAREGVTEQVLRARWDTKRDLSCMVGKQWHKAAEDWIQRKVGNSRFDDIFAIFSKWKFKGDLFTEAMVWNLDAGLAGMADLVDRHGRTVDIYDWKTNEDLDEENKYNKFMLCPLAYHPATNLGKYQLQLNAYAWMFRKHGYVLGNMFIFHVDLEGRKIKSYRVPVLQVEVDMMIDGLKPAKAVEELFGGEQPIGSVKCRGDK